MAEQFTSFKDWTVAVFEAQQNSMGELAATFAADEEFPTSARTWTEVSEHLSSIGADGSTVALARHAWSLYAGERTDFEHELTLDPSA